MLMAVGLDGLTVRSQYPLLAMYPRTQTHPVMSTVHATSLSPQPATAPLLSTEKTARLIAVKGSPLIVLSQCDHQLHHDEIRQIRPLTAVMTAVAIGSPLTVMQLLWLNLVTNVFPGLSLAVEPPEADVLTQPPRDPHAPIIKAADFGRITFEATVISLSALIAYAYGLWQYGAGMQAGTVLFMALTIGQVMHTLSCRSETETFWQVQRRVPNRWLIGAIALSLSLQLLPIVVPSLMILLHLTTLVPLDWLVVMVCALVPLLINEGSKSLSTRSQSEDFLIREATFSFFHFGKCQSLFASSVVSKIYFKQAKGRRVHYRYFLLEFLFPIAVSLHSI